MERAGRLFGRMKLPGNFVTSEDIARAAWAGAVGQRIAAKAQAIGLVRSTLVVEVEDQVWQRQLNTLRRQIVANIEKAIGKGIVTEIDFRPAGARRGPQRAERASSVALPPGDEAALIQDPVFRRLYIASRNKASA